MAIGTIKSTELTNESAQPVVLNESGTDGGAITIKMGSFEVATTGTDDVGDIILLARIPSSAIISGLWIQNDELDSGAGLLVNVGLYDSLGTTVKDADAFASAIDTLRADVAVWTDILTEAGAVPKALIGEKLHKWAGDDDDPQSSYIVAMTVTAAADTGVAGTLAYKVHYTVS